jgi:SulP family sulfate permease
LNIAYETIDTQERVRFNTGGPGTIVGEIGFYLGTPASATVTATKTGTVYSLSIQDFKRFEAENSTAAAVFHRFLLITQHDSAAERAAKLA